MGKKKNQGTAIGRSIIKDRFGHKPKSDDSFLHTSELDDGFEWGRLNLQSVTEQSNLEEFLTTAELAGTEFTAEKLNIKFIDPKRAPGLSASELKKIQNAQEENKSLLRIPRRPKWDESTTAEELDMAERNSFLEWRRNLASLQEKDHIVMTPYEKNLDFWRQLWRVIERSDIVVQIVDARNPLLFRCEDIEEYVREVDKNKVNLLLVNKADYLTDEQRAYWSQYFTSKEIRIVFWSALRETDRQKEKDGENKEVEGSEGEDNVVQDEDMETDQVNSQAESSEGIESERAEEITEMESGEKMDSDKLGKADAAEGQVKDSGNCDGKFTDGSEPETLEQSLGSDSATDDSATLARGEDSVSAGGDYCDDSKGDNSESNCRTSVCDFNKTEIVSGPELLDILRVLHTTEKYKEGVTTVGMIGYPNVGKSSTINAILQMKKVPVSATPGRTKHFQTLFVEPTLMLCDCPGLVFPSFVSTKADLVVNGILPIDQLRDHVAPTSLICEKIPRATLENIYSINIPLPDDFEGEDPTDVRPTAHELLYAYGLMRGFMTANGQPDGPRSARVILKDYVNGKLLFCEPPPNVSEKDFKPTAHAQPKALKKNTDELQLSLKSQGSRVTRVDQDFFKKTKSNAHSKGAQGVTGYVRTQGLKQISSSTSSSSGTPHSSQSSLVEKPWKKHNNRHKKEKLRRVYADYDQ